MSRKAIITRQEVGMANLKSYKNNRADGHSRQHNGDHHGDNITVWTTPVSRHPDDKSAEKDLIGAAEHGQIDCLKRSLATPGLDINYRGQDGRTAIRSAAQHGHLHAVKCLTEAGCKLDIPCDYGITPLCEAAYKGYADIVKFLIQAKADKKRICGMRGSALHAACFSGHASIVELLLEPVEGVTTEAAAKEAATTEAIIIYTNTTRQDPETGTVHFYTQLRGEPLWIAVFRGHAEIIPMLARFGASGDVSGRVQMTEEPVRKHWDAIFPVGEKRTALHIAMANYNVNVLQEVLRAKANVEAWDQKFGRTPLEYTAERGMLAHVRVLIDHKAKFNSVGTWGLTPLAWAAKSDNIELVSFLILKGAELDYVYDHILEDSDITAKMCQFLTDAREWTFV